MTTHSNSWGWRRLCCRRGRITTRAKEEQAAALLSQELKPRVPLCLVNWSLSEMLVTCRVDNLTLGCAHGFLASGRDAEDQAQACKLDSGSVDSPPAWAVVSIGPSLDAAWQRTRLRRGSGRAATSRALGTWLERGGCFRAQVRRCDFHQGSARAECAAQLIS